MEQSIQFRKNRSQLIWIALICAAPIVAAYCAFYFWRPTTQLNRGELLTPYALDWKAAQIVRPNVQGSVPLRGKWVMLYASDAQCDANCERALYYSRQVRTAQAKEMDRVTRVWLISGAAQPNARLLQAHPDLVVLRDTQLAQTLASLPVKSRAQSFEAQPLYLVDPRERVFMRYTNALKPEDVMKDLGRILKYSQLG